MQRRFTLRDANRLRRNADFVEIRSSSKPYRCPYFALHFRIRAAETDDADASSPRVGISVSKRVGNAVCRNKLKRRFRELFRLRQHSLKRACDVVISLRKPAANASFAELEQRFDHALKYKRLLMLGEERTDATDSPPSSPSGQEVRDGGASAGPKSGLNSPPKD